jgi:polygalacturonase
MTRLGWTRRKFLQNAGKGLATLPLAGYLPLALEAQKPAPAKTKAAEVSVPRPTVHLNARDLGATGDGKTKDTLALQQVLDRCSDLGGGEVLVPAGDYLTGALLLRSNTTLRLEEGASLLGSPDIADYPMTQVRWEGRWIKGYGAFINAQAAENVTVIGKGKIIASAEIKGRVRHADGSPMVYSRPPAGTTPTPRRSSDGPTNVASQDIIRNPALMEFNSCKNVLIQDVFTQGNDM